MQSNWVKCWEKNASSLDTWNRLITDDWKGGGVGGDVVKGLTKQHLTTIPGHNNNMLISLGWGEGKVSRGGEREKKWEL